MVSLPDVFCWLLLLFNPCLFSSACSPFQPSSLLCFHLSQFFVSLQSLCPSAFSPFRRLAPVTHGSLKAPLVYAISWSPVLLSLPDALPLPWALLPPSSVFPLIVHIAHSLLISYRRKSKYMKRGIGEKIRPIACLVQHTSTGTSCSRQEY